MKLIKYKAKPNARCSIFCENTAKKKNPLLNNASEQHNRIFDVELMLCVIPPFTLIYFRKCLKFYFNFPFSFYKSKQAHIQQKKNLSRLIVQTTQYLFDCIYQLFSIKNIFWLQSMGFVKIYVCKCMDGEDMKSLHAQPIFRLVF